MPDDREASAESVFFPAPDFDVRDYARTAVGSHRDALNLEIYAAAPLSTDTLRTLAYLRNIERATMTHLRGVLVTATHKDARITAFLTTWAFEKYWIADALDQIIQAHGDTANAAHFRTPVERTIRESIYANIVGVPMIGVHMSLGTIDEWLTQAAYRRIAELEPHPQLDQTLAAFLPVKARQLSFFEAQARFRLTDSERSRKLTRKRLRKTAWPIGARAESREATQFFYRRLFLSAPAIITELDARVDTLPGQSGLSLIGKAAHR